MTGIRLREDEVPSQNTILVHLLVMGQSVVKDYPSGQSNHRIQFRDVGILEILGPPKMDNHKSQQMIKHCVHGQLSFFSLVLWQGYDQG